MKRFIKYLKIMGRSYDNRQYSKIKYSFEEVIFIIIIGIISGNNDILECLYYAHDNINFLKKYFPYEYGIPYLFYLIPVLNYTIVL